MAGISLWLDFYDDIYSDFDSRHYLKRRISEDFIKELKEALKYRQGPVNDLELLLPAKLRDTALEKDIRLSLHNQLRERHAILNAKRTGMLRNGSLLLLTGILIMTLNSYITYRNFRAYPMVVLQLILEPASWFMIWNALEVLFFRYRQTKKEAALYHQMEQLNIRFKDL